MGLFSRKKKPSPDVPSAASHSAQAARQAASQQAASQQAAAQQAAEQTAKKAADQRKISEEESTMKKIADKRKDILQLERALVGFEAERNKLLRLALKARREEKENEKMAHMRAAKRLATRIKRYQDTVVSNQTQLDALEDAAFLNENANKNKGFVTDLTELAVDRDEIDNDIQDMRDAISGVNEVNLTFEADASMNKGIYEDEDAMLELDELESKMAKDAASQIPSVPGTTPAMPAAAPVNASEEDEIRQLELELAQ